MASKKNGKILKNSQILCLVEQALEDLLVVSFEAPNKKVFQGVLLDATKRSLPPLGINPAGGFQKRLTEDNPRGHAAAQFQPEVEVTSAFPTVGRRHTYFQDNKHDKPPLVIPAKKGGRSFMSGGALGVRLRARQVLCSKCSSVCNEKGENVKAKADKEKEGRRNDVANVEGKGGRKPQERRKPQVVIQVRKTPVVPNGTKTGRMVTNKLSRNVANINGQQGKKTTHLIHRQRVRSVQQANDDRLSRRLKGKPPEIKVETDPLKEKEQKKLAKSFSLVPKIKRLGKSELEKFGDVTVKEVAVPAPCTDNGGDLKILERTKKVDPKDVAVGKVSSSTEAFAENKGKGDVVRHCASNQPLRIKFSSLMGNRVNSNEPHYSIVSGPQNKGEADKKKENIPDDIFDDSLEEYLEEDGESGRVLRKKRSVGSMEDLWDENILEENQPLKKVLRLSTEEGSSGNSDTQSEKIAPVLKISFGKQSSLVSSGKKTTTVLRIPTKSLTEEQGKGANKILEELPMTKDRRTSASSKAAKKALKRAKKEAQRRAMYGGVSPARSFVGGRSPAGSIRSPATSGQSPASRSGLPSPARILAGAHSPAILAGDNSPGRLAGVPLSSPAHHSPAAPLAGISPAQFSSPVHPFGSGSPAYTLLCPGSQKIIIRKNKKKKNKDKKNRTKSTEKKELEEEEKVGKRNVLSQLAFPLDETAAPEAEDKDTSSGGSSRRSSTDEEVVFGEDKSVVLEKPGIAVESVVLPGGHTMCAGDVVWGKSGLKPWWPGKILNLMMMENPGNSSSDALVPQAQIAWYTSTTTSILPCSHVKPFLESFEAQYHRRKKGNYREAVQLASDDARQASSIPLASLSPSPREVDCIS